MPLKLFMWKDPYPVKYGQSMVFAVAESLAEAKQLAARGHVFSHGLDFSDGSAFPDKVARRRVELGQPTRVVALPCAEWHEWSE